jgi:23S rRNA pseudouridine1911/1915/1917 synthase
MPGMPTTLTVAPEQAGQRLDAFLGGFQLPESRSQLRKAFDEGRVRVNGTPEARPARKVKAGEVVEYQEPELRPAVLEPEAIPLDVVFEDRHLIVVDKPAGLVVHPAAGHAAGTLVHALLHHCTDLSGIGGELRPGIVHRLDKDTSGLLVCTKDDATHQALSALFKAHTLVRRYLAIVVGHLGAASGTVRALHGRHPVDRKRFSSKVEVGRPAVTHWRRLESLAGADLVEARLETGRTHQIRVHFSDLGHAVLGDAMYGHRPGPSAGRAAGPVREAWDELGRQALHATVLGFRHPITGEDLLFERPPPADFQRALERLRAARPAPELG